MDERRERELLARYDAPPEGRFAEINGMELYYEVHGAGEPLLLLHNFTRSSRIWAKQLPFFARHFRVITPDLRGHGRSNNPSREFTHRQSAQDIAALVDHLGIERCKALGFSSGGMTLVHLATRQPARIEALILAAATSHYPAAAREVMSRTDPDTTREDVIREMGKEHLRGEEQARDLLRQFRGFMDSYEDMNFTAPLLSTIRARTLIIHGDRDQYFDVGIPVEMYRAIPDSYLWITPNTSHAIFREHLDLFPDAFQNIALAFLRGDWERRQGEPEDR